MSSVITLLSNALNNLEAQVMYDTQEAIASVVQDNMGLLFGGDELPVSAYIKGTSERLGVISEYHIHKLSTIRAPILESTSLMDNVHRIKREVSALRNFIFNYIPRMSTDEVLDKIPSLLTFAEGYPLTNSTASNRNAYTQCSGEYVELACTLLDRAMLLLQLDTIMYKEKKGCKCDHFLLWDEADNHKTFTYRSSYSENIHKVQLIGKGEVYVSLMDSSTVVPHSTPPEMLLERLNKVL